MKHIDTLIEVLDDAHVRVYRRDGVRVLSDDELVASIGKRVLLTDPVHVFHARLPMALRKKQLQAAVLSSLVEDNLTAPAETFTFAGHVSGTHTDIAWLSQTRQSELLGRFESISDVLLGIVPTSLLMTRAETVGTHIIHHAPWHYVRKNASAETSLETLTLSDSLLPVWRASVTGEIAERNFSETDLAWQEINDVPVIVLAKTQAKDERTSWGKTWLWATVLVTLVMALWGGNEYVALQTDKAQLRHVKDAQVTLLKRIFPNTNSTSDPYGRVLSEASALSGVTFLQRINDVLAKDDFEFRDLRANLTAQTVTLSVLSSEDVDALKATLIDAGFAVMHDGQSLTVTGGQNE